MKDILNIKFGNFHQLDKRSQGLAKGKILNPTLAPFETIQPFITLLILLLRKQEECKTFKNQFPIFCSDYCGYCRNTSYSFCFIDHLKCFNHEDENNSTVAYHECLKRIQQHTKQKLMGFRPIVPDTCNRFKAYLFQIWEGDWS